MKSEKLQKVLANCGLGSRRELETWIAAGRVSVNGKIVGVGCRVVPNDAIRVDGHVVKVPKPASEARRVLIYHKPDGQVCTRSDPEGRVTIYDKLPQIRRQRWITVGRLDINSTGLLLITNDGELAHRLMHPKYEIERVYAVRVLGKVTHEMLLDLLNGVELSDGVAHFDKIDDAGGQGANHWYHVTLKEGRQREVRRLWESQGLTVSRLIRISYGLVKLPRGLSVGKVEELTPKEVKQLAKSVGL